MAARVRADVHGACIGAGIELAAFAGRVVATPDAFFQLPEVAHGTHSGRRRHRQPAAPDRAPAHRVARAHAAGALDAATARAWGLIDAIDREARSDGFLDWPASLLGTHRGADLLSPIRATAAPTAPSRVRKESMLPASRFDVHDDVCSPLSARGGAGGEARRRRRARRAAPAPRRRRSASRRSARPTRSSWRSDSSDSRPAARASSDACRRRRATPSASPRRRRKCRKQLGAPGEPDPLGDTLEAAIVKACGVVAGGGSPRPRGARLRERRGRVRRRRREPARECRRRRALSPPRARRRLRADASASRCRARRSSRLRAASTRRSCRICRCSVAAATAATLPVPTGKAVTRVRRRHQQGRRAGSSRARAPGSTSAPRAFIKCAQEKPGDAGCLEQGRGHLPRRFRPVS